MKTHPLFLARKSRKLTLKEVAEIVGTDTGNISRIENGLQMPSPEFALKILDVFPNVSMVDILKHYSPQKRTVKKTDSKQSDTVSEERVAA